MKGASKVIMGATLAMVVTLALVLTLILLLLAELYCSLLLRRRSAKLASSAENAEAAAGSIRSSVAASNVSTNLPSLLSNSSASRSLSVRYSRCALQSPGRTKMNTIQRILELELSPESRRSFPNSPAPALDVPVRISNDSKASASDREEQLVYISNPIYDSDDCQHAKMDTPFQTPISSPSFFDTRNDSSPSPAWNEKHAQNLNQTKPTSVLDTPPLTPMKEFPSAACSAPLAASSGSETASNLGLSSSSTSSPSTSTW